MGLVKLNWTTINGISNKLANFDGKVEDGLKSALKKSGFSNYWAGVTAKFISFIFF